MSAGSRLNLCIPAPLLERLTHELDFLGVSTRAVLVEDREIRNRNEFIRLLVDQYFDRFEQGGVAPCDYEEKTEYLPLYLDKTSKGRWDHAIRERAAATYHNLAANALDDYFRRSDERSRLLAVQFEAIKTSLATLDRKLLKELTAR